MSDRTSRSTLSGRVMGWLVIAVAAALVARLVWELLWPLLPVLVCGLMLGGVLWFIFGRNRWSA